MVRLIWTGGPRQSYGTRRMVAGGEFEASRRDADLLIRIGQAMLAPDAPPSPASTAREPAAVTVAPPSVSREMPEPEPEPPDESPDDWPVEPHEPAPEPPPEPPAEPPARRPRGRPPIHGRYSRRDS